MEIEKEQIRCRNSVLEKMLQKVISNKELLKSLSENHNISIKKNNREKSEIEESIDNLKHILEEEKNKQTIISTKNFLSKYFRKYRDKFEKRQNLLVAGLPVGFGMLLALSLPLFIAYSTSTISINFILASLNVLVVSLSCSIGAVIFSIKNNKNYLQVFEKLNNELGKEKLEDIYTEEESIYLQKELDKIINNVYRLNLQLESEKKSPQYNDNLEEKEGQTDTLLNSLELQVGEIRREEAGPKLVRKK